MTEWKPSKDLDWQDKAECAKPDNRDKMESFFSEDPREKSEARALCFSCPVRKDCVKWALENNTIWGIWGGKDEGEIRRTLSVSWNGQESRRQRFPQCPYCNARPNKLHTLVVDVPGGGRWNTMKLVKCEACDFTWRSRTSANAVDAYHAQKKEKKVKPRKKKTKKKKEKE